jgi:predicted HAD superfamily Cof-like phosphohydrolase
MRLLAEVAAPPVTPMTNSEMVGQFHAAFGVVEPDEPTYPVREVRVLRTRLIEEETNEVYEAVVGGNLADIAKELADLLVVTYGTARTFGIDIDAVFAEVHRSNMSKLDEDGKPIYREDGKVLKGPNYSEANLDAALGL